MFGRPTLLFIIVIVFASAICLGFPAEAQATIFNFAPTPNDLNELDHWYYYQWVINWTVPAGEQIDSAILRIHNINDWTVESGDILYMHLLNFSSGTPTGVTSGYDAEGGGDHFSGQGVTLPAYTDDDGWPNPSEDWSHTFTSAEIASLTSYSSDSRFGFGFDPDCHYYNDGICFRITTSRTPEPATMSLLGLGLIGFVVKIQKRKGVRKNK